MIYFEIDREERADLLDIDHSTRRIMSGVLLPDAELVVIALDNYRVIAIPFAQFTPGSQGPSGKTAVGVVTNPDFASPAICDHGYTLAFGEFEACLDAIILDADAKLGDE